MGKPRGRHGAQLFMRGGDDVGGPRPGQICGTKVLLRLLSNLSRT
jgi:hypothetical protein